MNENLGSLDMAQEIMSQTDSLGSTLDELGEYICSSGRLAGPRACIEVYVESHSDNLRELQADGEVCHIIREQNIYGPNVIFRHVIGLDPTTDLLKLQEVRDVCSNHGNTHTQGSPLQ
jgi:hypothetical protein